MSSLLSQLQKTIHAHQLIQPGDKILVAVSGGIDSLVLAHLLGEYKIATKNSIELKAAHVYIAIQ